MSRNDAAILCTRLNAVIEGATAKPVMENPPSLEYRIEWSRPLTFTETQKAQKVVTELYQT
jgi:hypothetical protein